MGHGKRPARAAGRRGFSVHLANERTFLSGVRSGVAVMAFGFVVARFALFLRRLGEPGGPGSGADGAVGAAITALGGVVTLLAALRFVRRHRQIEVGRWRTSTRLELTLGVLLAAAGFGLAGYLLVRGGA